MAETLHAGVTSYQILRSCRFEQLPNGNVLYTSTAYTEPGETAGPLSILATKEGQPLLREDLLAQFLTFEGPLPLTRGRLGGQTISVQRMADQDNALSGTDQLRALQDLTAEGVKCAAPLLATRGRFISKWVDGPLPNTQDEFGRFLDYINVLEEVFDKLKRNKGWKEEWNVSPQAGSYISTGFRSLYPLDNFVAIDPISSGY